MAQIISPPGIDPVDRQDEQNLNLEVNQGWRNFFNAAYNILTGLTQSGPTSQRPTRYLWVGRPYWDTTIDRIVYWNGSEWIFAPDNTGSRLYLYYNYGGF